MNSLLQDKRFIKFSLPGYYLFYSRLLRRSERISWLLVFPLAVLWPCILVAPDDWAVVLGVFAVSFLAWIAVYELGYIENDVFTVDRETSPTLRIAKSEMDWLKGNFHGVVVARLLLLFLFTYVLWHLFGDHVSMVYYFFVIGLTRMAFHLHNRLRSRWNILTYFILSLGKYLFLALILYQLEFPLLLLALILVFPLPRTLEHACKVKYGLRTLKSLVGEFDLFRVRYYGIAVVACGALAWRFPGEGWLVPTAVLVYFLLFRTFVWAVIKFANYRRTEFEVHQWDKE